MKLRDRAKTWTRVPRLNPPASYGVALVIAVLTALVQSTLVKAPAVAPFVLLYLGVTLVARVAGTRPGLVATLVSAALGNYFFISPSAEFSLVGTPLVATALFVLTASAIAVMCGSLRAARLEAEDKASQLRRYALLVEHTREMVFFTRPSDGRILDVNRAALDTYGYSREELLARTVYDLRAPDRRQDARAQIERADSSEWVFETVHQRRDGTQFPVEVSTRGADIGSERAVMSLVRDISERKRAEEDLRRSEQRNRRLIEVSAQIVWSTDASGEHIEDSTAWSAFTGRPAEQLKGPAWANVVHPADRAMLAARWDEARRDRQPYEAEFRILDAHGEYRYVLTRAAPLFAADGSVREWIGMSTDITERKRAEAAVVESEARFRGVVENMPDAVTLYDADGRVSYVNPAIERIIGLQARDLVGRRASEVWPVAAVPRLGECLERAYAGERVREEYTAQTPAGKTVTRQMVQIPILGADGRIRHVLALGHDVTEERHMVEALREMNQRKDEFLAMLSHELRNPLAPIRNSVFILKKAGLSAEQSARAVTVIDRQSAHLARIVNDLLDLGRISRNAIALHRARVELNALVLRTVEDYASAFAVAGVALDVSTDREPVVVDGDEQRLVQVLGNLLQNASKFTPPGGRAQVQVRRADKEAEVTVSDTGVGITPDVLARLFQPFVQADRTLERSKGGIGLGLALSKSIVELHGGQLVASSDGAGRGARFVIRLPRVQ